MTTLHVRLETWKVSNSRCHSTILYCKGLRKSMHAGLVSECSKTSVNFKSLRTMQVPLFLNLCTFNLSSKKNFDPQVDAFAHMRRSARKRSKNYLRKKLNIAVTWRIGRRNWRFWRNSCPLRYLPQRYGRSIFLMWTRRSPTSRRRWTLRVVRHKKSGSFHYIKPAGLDLSNIEIIIK